VRRLAAGIAGALVLGPSALAAPPADVPELVVWARQHLTGVDDWPLLSFTSQGITLASPKGATLRPDGLVEGELRQEFFEPVELDGRIMRSAASRWRVDCAGQRFAVLQITLYARNDLKDRLGERKSDKPPWLARDAMSGDAIDAMCEAVQTGERLDAPKSQD